MIGPLFLLGLYTFPLWTIMLGAPQYPDPLGINIHIDGIRDVNEFDIQNIDGLNHYIGMRPLDEAANIERSLAPVAVVVIALMILGVALIHHKWFALFAIPAMTFPVIFLARSWAPEPSDSSAQPQRYRSAGISPLCPRSLWDSDSTIGGRRG